MSADPSAPAVLDVPRLLFLCEQQEKLCLQAAQQCESGSELAADYNADAAQWLAVRPALPALVEAGALLDALDARRELVNSVDGRQPIAHAWRVYGHCDTVREALRGLLPAAPALREEDSREQ